MTLGTDEKDGKEATALDESQGVPPSAAPRARISWTQSRGRDDAETLVLVFHGMDCGPDTMHRIADLIEAEIPSSHILIPALPFRWYHCADLKEVAEEVLRYLDAYVHPERFKSILLVGHSAGGVLAQAVYILSRNQSHTLRKVPADKIRLVLIAPLSRGWQISHHLPLTNKISWKFGLALIPLLRLIEHIRSVVHGRRREEPWMLQLQRGAPFLIWMRLAWLELTELPQLFILLGSVDEVISWRDMVDEVHSAKAVYYQVPYSDHARIIDFNDQEHGEARKAILAQALTGPLSGEIRPWDEEPVPPDPGVKRVVFVIHGIRDEGHWTQKIGACARDSYEAAGLGTRKQIRIVTSSYGYFSMLEFLTSGSRLLKIHWLMDQYVEARRRFPEANFSFIGHSNGTYLIAQALKLYPEVKFERIAFAGSVVSSKFDWSVLQKQVSYVLNFTATRDWVVALFPRIADVVPPMQWALGPNLGGAGIEPFLKVSAKPAVKNNNYVKGVHSAAIQEEKWISLAEFAVLGPPPPIPPDKGPSYERTPSVFFYKIVGKIVSVLVWVGLVVVLAWYLPRLAWMNPCKFWLWPGAVVVGGIVLIALNQARRSGVRFSKRKQIDAISGGIVAIMGIALLGLLGWSTVIAWHRAWYGEASDALRMLSVVVYVWLLFKALTKV